MEQTVDINNKITPVLADAAELAIMSQGSLEIANTMRQGIKRLIKEVTDTFGPIKQKTHSAWKEAVAQEKKYLDPLETADKRLKDKMGQYLLTEQAERQKETDRLAEIARKEKEKEIEKANKKLEALMDKAGNLDAQIEALAAELQKQTSDDEAAIIRAQLNGLLAKKASLDQKVSAQAAQAEQAITAPTIIPSAPEKPKVNGMSFRTEKRGNVINKLLIVQACAKGSVPLDVLDINTTILNKLVNAGLTIPGVVIETVPITSTRTK